MGAFVMVQNSPISYTPSYITVTFKKQTNKKTKPDVHVWFCTVH